MGFFNNLGMVQRLGAAGLVVLLLVMLLVKQRNGAGGSPKSDEPKAPKARKASRSKGKAVTSATAEAPAKPGKSRRGRAAKGADADGAKAGRGRGRRRKKGDDVEQVEAGPVVGRMVPRLPSAADTTAQFSDTLNPPSETTDAQAPATADDGGPVAQPGWPTPSSPDRWSEHEDDEAAPAVALPVDATQPIEAVAEALPAADDAAWATDADEAFDPATGWTGEQTETDGDVDQTHTEWTEETSDWTSGEAGWETVASDDAAESTWTNSDEPTVAPAIEEPATEWTSQEPVSDWEPVEEIDEPEEQSFTDWGSVDETPVAVVADAEPVAADDDLDATSWTDDDAPSFTDWSTADADPVEPIVSVAADDESSDIATFDWNPTETDGAESTLAEPAITALADDTLITTTDEFTIEPYGESLDQAMPMVFDDLPSHISESHVPAGVESGYGALAGDGDTPPVIDAVDGVREITISALEGDDDVDATVIHSPAFDRPVELADMTPVVGNLDSYAPATMQPQTPETLTPETLAEPVYAHAAPLSTEAFEEVAAPVDLPTVEPSPEPIALEETVPAIAEVSAPVLPAAVPNPLERWAGLTPITTDRRRPTLNPMRSWERMSAGPMPERVGEPAMSAMAPSARLPQPTTPAGALANSVFSLPAPREPAPTPAPTRRAEDALATVTAAPQAEPAAAWWDMPIDAELTARRGRFALGGYALQAGHQVVSGVTFREAAIPPPSAWLIGPVQGSVAPGTLVLTVDGCLNCRAEDLVVLMEPGFAPTQDGFSLRLSGLQQGAFAASGTYVIH